MDLWAYANDVTLDFSRPGKPTDNAFIEAFNGRFRAECLNAHWFMSLEDAAEKLEAWRRDLYDILSVKLLFFPPVRILVHVLAAARLAPRLVFGRDSSRPTIPIHGGQMHVCRDGTKLQRGV